MDDNRTFVEFPIGSSGRYVKVKEPTDSQRLLLALSRAPSQEDKKATVALVQRLFRVLEVLSGDQWTSVIEDGLITELFTVVEVMDVIHEVATFNWKAVTLPLPEPEEDPGPVPTPPVEERPGPRVVGG